MRYKLLLFAHDGGIDGTGGFLAGAHGQDDGGSAGNGIAASVDHRAAGQAVRAVGDQATVLVGVQTRRGGADQRVGWDGGGRKHPARPAPSPRRSYP